MKSFMILLVCFASATCLGATTDDVQTTGEWSKPVDGVRGRLLFGEDEKFNGTRMGVIYLELQNVSDLANPKEIYFDIHHALKCELLDPHHKVVPHPAFAASILTLFSYWMTLPHDSSLRIRVSVKGYGISKDAGLFIGMIFFPWEIPPDARDDYSFTASFRSNPPKDERKRAWQGVLKLPEVKIPVKNP